MSFKELKNKHIENIQISEDDTVLSFLINVEKSQLNEDETNLKTIWPSNPVKTPYVVMQYGTTNDCFNHVWFEDFVNLEGLINSAIYEVEIKPWQNITSDQHDVLEAGFWTIKTSKGYCDIEVRNSHNGYYGGSVAFSGIYTDFKVFDELSTFKQKKINTIVGKEILDSILPLKPTRKKGRSI